MSSWLKKYCCSFLAQLFSYHSKFSATDIFEHRMFSAATLHAYLILVCSDNQFVQ